MSTAPKHSYTVEEYFALEALSPTKHEYYRGDMFAMGGGTPEHGLITANVIGELRTQLKGSSCRVYSSEVRIKIAPTGLYTYPDAMVVCGEVRVEGPKPGAILNPRLVVEVLSSSTEEYDRTTKFAHYRTIESLTDYLLVAQDAHCVEHYVRQPDGQWKRWEYCDLQSVIPLDSTGCKLPLSEIYAEVDIPSQN